MFEARKSYLLGDVERAKDKAFQKEHINGTIRIPAFAEWLAIAHEAVSGDDDETTASQ